uniref:Uncharacterized protein n=1 Tax=Quercus lobata TaxID=97700 RepID=A0A7N2LRW8_QUELO
MSTEAKEESEKPIFQFDSSKEIQVEHDRRATATLETETEFSRDACALRIHGYTNYKAGFRREQTFASGKAGGAHGPLRASAHIRVSARFDYQPDIWDYKSGWQMEKEWDEAEKARKRNLALGLDDEDDGCVDLGEEDDEDDLLLFACFICRQPFVDAVVTKCKHYFYEHCALKMRSSAMKTNHTIKCYE